MEIVMLFLAASRIPLNYLEEYRFVMGDEKARYLWSMITRWHSATKRCFKEAAFTQAFNELKRTRPQVVEEMEVFHSPDEDQQWDMSTCPSCDAPNEGLGGVVCKVCEERSFIRASPAEVPSREAAMAEQETYLILLRGKTCKELKAQCRDEKLPVSGKKAVLVGRLMNNLV